MNTMPRMDAEWGEREKAAREEELKHYENIQPTATQVEKVNTDLNSQRAITGSATPPGKKTTTQKKEKVGSTKKTTDK